LEDVRKLADVNAVVMLVGNKSDLVSQRNVSVNEVKEFAGFFYCCLYDDIIQLNLSGFIFKKKIRSLKTLKSEIRSEIYMNLIQ
jgi:hypothetical protein